MTSTWQKAFYRLTLILMQNTTIHTTVDEFNMESLFCYLNCPGGFCPVTRFSTPAPHAGQGDPNGGPNVNGGSVRVAV